MFEKWLVALGWLQYEYQGHHHFKIYPYINQLESLGHFIKSEEHIKEIQQAEDKTWYYNVKYEGVDK